MSDSFFFNDGPAPINQTWKYPPPTINTTKKYVIEIAINGGTEQQHGEMITSFLKSLCESNRTIGNTSLIVQRINEQA